MLAATASLARRIETAECRLTVDCAEIIRERRSDVFVGALNGGAAVYAGPGQPFNKVIGLGFDGLDDEGLTHVERAFAERGAPVQVEIATLADPSIAARLTRRGYALVGFENVLGLPLNARFAARASEDRLVDEAAGIAVSRAAREDLPAWIDAVTAGFAAPDVFDGPPSHESFSSEALAQVFRDLAGAPGFVQYLARRQGEVAGGASMRLFDGLAQLAGAATVPAHRRHGVQSALLRVRLLDAARSGCDLAVVTTQPGSKSQENVQRAGFELLYARAVLVK